MKGSRLSVKCTCTVLEHVHWSFWLYREFWRSTVRDTLLSTSLRLICDWTMYMSESTNPEHSLSLRRASLRSELTFLRSREQHSSDTLATLQLAG